MGFIFFSPVLLAKNVSKLFVLSCGSCLPFVVVHMIVLQLPFFFSSDSISGDVIGNNIH